jgi:hypothetical protein
LAQEDAGDSQVSHGHALVIAQHVSAGQRIIEHAGRNVPLPKRVVVRRTNGPEQAAGAFAGGKGCGREVAENEGEYVLFESLHAAGSDTPRVKTIGKNRESSAWNLSHSHSSAPPPHHPVAPTGCPRRQKLARKRRNIPQVLSSKMLRNFSSIFCF